MYAYGVKLNLNHRYRNLAGAHPLGHQRPLPIGISHGKTRLPTCPIPGNAEALMLGGGTVTPSYHSCSSVHAIAAPIRFVEGEAIETSMFFALASDSSTDR